MRRLAALLVGAALLGVGTAQAAPPAQAVCAAPAQTVASVRLAQTTRGPIAYARFGQGEPIVLVTGFRATIAEWDARFLAALAREHEVVVFDNRGIGASIPDATRFTVEDMAADTAALIGALSLHRPTVLGWSMGGAVVQRLAIDAPGAIGRMVLLGSLAPGTDGVAVEPQVLRALSGEPGIDFAGIMALLFPPSVAADATRCFRQDMFHPADYREPPISAAVTAGQTALLDAWSHDDMAASLLRTLRLPVLIVAGQNDAVVSPRNAQALRALLTHAHLRIFPVAGHALMYQYPAPLAQELDAFVNE